MSDFYAESLTPMQRLLWSRLSGETPEGALAGGLLRPDGSGFDPMQSGVTLRPEAEGTAITTYGLPPNLLRGSGVVPAQQVPASPQTKPANRTGEAGLLPTPTVPDYGPELERYGAALQGQARNRVTQQDLGGMEAEARAQGFRAGLQALPTFDARDAAYRWNTVVPQSLGAPALIPLPTRNAPGQSALAQGIAALASLVDPRAAGNYSAAPLQAGIEAANTQYNDRLRQFALAQEQANTQYAAERADAEQANRFALMNAEASQTAAVRARQAQDEAALRRVPYESGAADAEALATRLPMLADRERTSLASGAEAEAILEKINLTDKQYGQALEAARYTNNPLARIQVEMLRQQGFYYRALLRKLEANPSAAGDGGMGRPGAGAPQTGKRPAATATKSNPPTPVPTPSSPAATRSPAPTATPPGRPSNAPTSRFAPGVPNAPTTSIR